MNKYLTFKNDRLKNMVLNILVMFMLTSFAIPDDSRFSRNFIQTEKLIGNNSQGDCSGSLFPVNNITLGKTTISDVNKLGYKCNPYSQGNSMICAVHKIFFWDFEKKGILIKMLIDKNISMPEQWKRNFDFDWRLSYSDWLSKLSAHCFQTVIIAEPEMNLVTDDEKGTQRETLYAVVKAVDAKGLYEIKLTFEHGNKDGEGAEINSPSSLYSIEVNVPSLSK